MITKTKNQLLTEMVKNAGVDPTKVLGADEVVSDEEESVSEARKYEVPRSKKGMVPKTPENLKKRVKLLYSAADNVANALKDMSHIPPMDYFGDIPYFQKELNDVLYGEDGNGGLLGVARQYADEMKKGK